MPKVPDSTPLGRGPLPGEHEARIARWTALRERSDWLLFELDALGLLVRSGGNRDRVELPDEWQR